MDSTTNAAGPDFDLDTELKIAPRAIPITKQDLIQGGVNIDSLLVAQAASTSNTVKVCTAENRPYKKSISDSFDKILSPEPRD